MLPAAGSPTMPTRVLGRTMAALVAADRLNVNDTKAPRWQLRRVTLTTLVVWPGLNVRVPFTPV